MLQLAGTASRKTAWIAVLANLALGSAVIWAGPEVRNGILAVPIFPLLGLAAIWMFATLIRRLHDINRSGAWALLCLLPIVGVVVVLLILFWPPTAQKFVGSPAGRVGAWLLFAALMIICVLRVFHHPYQIVAEDMAPTLLIGDYVVVTPVLRAPGRGEVVLIRQNGRGDGLLKRIIGMPGDRVQMRGGRLWLNGEEVAMMPSGDFVQIKKQYGPMGNIPRCANDPVPEGGDCVTPRNIEELPDGRSYAVLNLADGTMLDDSAEITLAGDEYYLLGDNRDNSADSRLPVEAGGLGVVRRDEIRGRARWVLVSATGWSPAEFWTWRKGRFFEAVQ
ncbi:signal peptidase I [Paracoccus caeni]|uniref:signal peptidase I n=1 Tax=Paracoccus caeni TaxID=657651 RepID=UPI002D80CC80|nr:signal peptidase I [Paracoccus caeni]